MYLITVTLFSQRHKIIKNRMKVLLAFFTHHKVQ